MKRMIALIAAASMTIAPVAAQQTGSYNVVDPNDRTVSAPAAAPAPVQTAQTRGTDPTDQRYQMRARKPGKPAPEFWYLLAAGVVAVAFFAVIDKGPNHGVPLPGQAGVNQP